MFVHSSPVRICGEFTRLKRFVSRFGRCSCTLSPYLKHTDEGLREIVKVASPGSVVRKVEFAPEHLHSQQRENDNEEEEEEEQRGDGAHRVQKRSHEVTQGGPVPVKADKV